MRERAESSEVLAVGENANRKGLRRAFAQILGKFYFFDLRENLRRILFDYGQNRSDPANGAFKAAC